MEEINDTPVDQSKLTKGQKKALKDKQKKEEAAKALADGKGDEEFKTPTPTLAPTKAGGVKAKGKCLLIFRHILI
jgi:hypothetical protein